MFGVVWQSFRRALQLLSFSGSGAFEREFLLKDGPTGTLYNSNNNDKKILM